MDVSSFLYRLPRFPIDFGLVFLVDSEEVGGRCKNLSDTGLLGKFSQPLATDSVGVLRLLPANLIFEINAVVTNTESFESGLHFLFKDEQERHLIRAIVQAASYSLARER